MSTVTSRARWRAALGTYTSLGLPTAVAGILFVSDHKSLAFVASVLALGAFVRFVCFAGMMLVSTLTVRALAGGHTMSDKSYLRLITEVLKRM